MVGHGSRQPWFLSPCAWVPWELTHTTALWLREEKGWVMAELRFSHQVSTLPQAVRLGYTSRVLFCLAPFPFTLTKQWRLIV